jgi:hypothetical protein
VAEAASTTDLVAVAGNAMPGLKELRGLVGVDMQQRAGLAPLKRLNVWRVPRRRRETP